MAYCNIEHSFLGNKLNDTFLPSNRNKIANIIQADDFKSWFANGRKDIDGNPVLDETLSFTNEQGQKRTVFDFPAVNFENTAEVRRVLTSSPAIYAYNDSLFINNTSKDVQGEFLAKKAMRLVNTIN